MNPLTTLPIACAAPPLTDEKLAEYKQIIDSQSGELKGALQACYDCVMAWWELPESTLAKEPTAYNLRPDGSVTCQIHPLQADHIAKLDTVTPWEFELAAIKQLFAKLPTGLQEVPATKDSKGKNVVADKSANDLHNCAHCLLWYAMEITRDREPITQDKLVVKNS